MLYFLKIEKIKSRTQCQDMWKFYDMQISVSIKKVLLEYNLFICLCTIHGYLHATIAELRCCDRDSTAYTNWNIYSLALYRKFVKLWSVWIYHNLFIYLTIEKHLGNFHFGDTANRTVMNIIMHFLCEHMCAFLLHVLYFRMELLCFRETLPNSIKRIVQIYTPSGSVWEFWLFNTLSNTWEYILLILDILVSF